MTSFPTWPCFTEEEGEAAKSVILSNRVNQWTGDRVVAFEKAFASWCGTRHAVAVTNGTLALELALRALRIGPGDDVIVSPRSFMASVSCVLNVGARPIFADVDRDSGNLSAATIEAALTPQTKSIIIVHLAGWPADMDAIGALAGRRGLSIIEDCAQAHGARIGNRSVGSFGTIGAWSFCQDKIMTTGGEGGMVTTDDPALYEFMWSYKDHGKSRSAVFERSHPPGFRWVHDSIGSNWRMLEVQAAIGLIQIGRMPEWQAARTRNAEALIAVLREFPDLVRTPTPNAASTHAYYRLYAYLHPDLLAQGLDRNALIDAITAHGVPAFHGSCSEIYLEGAFADTGLRPAERLPTAKELGETSLMFLTHPSIDGTSLDRYCAAIYDALREFKP